MYTHSSAVQLIEEAFPSLREDLHDEIIDGLLHPQIGEFARYAPATDTAMNNDFDRAIAIITELEKQLKS